MKRLAAMLLATFMSAVPQAAAQVTPLPADHAPDLAFPRRASELTFFSPLEMGIWKPAGAGPFPAVVLVHTCAGLAKQNMGFWRKEAIARGYVVFVIDSFSARGSPSCRGFPHVSHSRGARDMLQAVAHLRSLTFVDASRIGVIGASWGAMIGLRAANPEWAERWLPGGHVAAIVGLYPLCRSPRDGADFVPPNTTTALLILMGEKDTETPAEPCVASLERLRQRNAPVEWHVYPSATHCWDCEDQDGQRWSPPWAEGKEVVYRYDARTTRDSAERAFDFLSRRLAKDAAK